MIRPIRSPFAGDQSFVKDFSRTAEDNLRKGAELAAAGLNIRAENDAAKRVAQAQMELQSAGGGGGIGSWLGAASQALGAIGGIAGWGKGGGSSFGGGFTSKNFEMPGYMSGAGNFSSFYN